MSDCSKALNILSLSFSKIPIPVSFTLKIKCILLSSKIFFKIFPSSSFPITLIIDTSCIALTKFLATFDAPPSTIVSLVLCSTGTGASGDNLFASPKKYLSNIISPITNTFFVLILFNCVSIFIFLSILDIRI